MISNYVKAAGGCSAPSLADMDSYGENWKNENEVY